MERHPNADLLHAIADGKTIRRYVHDTNEWIDVSNPLESLIEGLTLHVGETYMNINGFKVPSPIDTPLNKGEHYFLVNVSSFRNSERLTWAGDGFDMLMLERGLVHHSPENAELHANALISFSKNGN